MPGVRKSNLRFHSAILYNETLIHVFATALDALDNLRAKFKSVFKKKPKTAAEPAAAPTTTTTAPVTEPTKTEAPAAAPVGKLTYPLPHNRNEKANRPHSISRASHRSHNH